MGIEEYGLHATTYIHKKSGAQVMSVIAPEDNNKVFGIVFRTPPEDSTGLPHILEHSVLCGSRKFPVKEPFVDLIKGSLNTFLNAFTYPDRTCYPVASMNTKDFYNLIHVYLDAVLHPRALNDPQVLQQEGWHYELEDVQEPLKYKGVVYNEMKGVYSSPDSIMARATQQALFPDNAYGVDSGGDPRAIPDLTFEQFQAFHKKYYHPSNARVYFYGDDDPQKRLDLLDTYLSEFDKRDVQSHVQWQKKKDAMPTAKLNIAFPVAPGTEPKHMVTVNWLLNDEPLSPHSQLALSVLDALLLGRSSSPLRKALTESGLGESVMGGGLSDELLQATFSVGLKGVAPSQVSAVEELVLKEIHRLSLSGFDAADVQSALNTLEFQLREFNTGGFPKGLSLMLGMMGEWNYDRDPVEGVKFERALASLKAELAAGKPVFQNLLSNMLVTNTHRVTVEMTPDEELEQQNRAREEGLLSSIKATLSVAEIEEIIRNTKALKAAQAAEDSAEARATIPRLSLADIDREVSTVPIQVSTPPGEPGVSWVTHDLQTSGILYADVGFDISTIDEEDLELLPLLTRLITETGTATLSEVELQRQIGSTTGGIAASTYLDAPSVPGTLADLNDPVMYLMIRGKATKERAGHLFSIFGDVVLNCRLDNQKRTVEILKEMKVQRETSVITAGHSYGATRLAARHSLLGYIGEVTGGLTFTRRLASLLALAESDWSNLQTRLEALRARMVHKGKMVVNLTGSKDVLAAAEEAAAPFLAQLPAAPAAPSDRLKLADRFSKDHLFPSHNEGFSVPSQVNYVVKGAQVVSPGEAIRGSYSVASRYLSTGFLWDHIRVMGGAYGGFARFSAGSGRASFLSYRDPNLADTLSTYDRAPEVLKAEAVKLSEKDVLQAIIGTVGDLDSPMGPDAKGFVSMQRHLTGETTEERQRWRDEVLSTTAADLLDFAKRLESIQQGSAVVFGSADALAKANKALPSERQLHIEAAIPTTTGQK